MAKAINNAIHFFIGCTSLCLEFCYYLIILLCQGQVANISGKNPLSCSSRKGGNHHLGSISRFTRGTLDIPRLIK